MIRLAEECRFSANLTSDEKQVWSSISGLCSQDRESRYTPDGSFGDTIVDIVNLLHNSSCLCVDLFFLLRALLLELGEFRLFDYLILFEEKKKQEKVAKRALREDAGNRPEEQGSDR